MKKLDILYYIAIFGTFVINLTDISEIINIEKTFRIAIYLVLAILFIIKIIFTKYSKKQLIVIAVFGLISLYITYILDNYMFIINFLAIVGIKDIKMNNVVKIDIIVKLFFLLFHTIIYFYDYLCNYENVVGTFVYTKAYGIRHSLYFSHPNTAAGITIWLAIDMLYISKNISKTYIISTLIILFYYYFTVSRTSIIVYILFSLLLLLNNKKPEYFNKKTNFILKYLIDILAIGSIVLVLIPTVINNSNIIEYIDKILSKRLYFSQWALDLYGFNLLPNAETSILDKALIVDNFYIRCLVSYGFITHLMLSIKYKLLPKNIKNMDRIILMLLPFYLFNELFCYNIGRAIPLLILANALFNNKENGETNAKNKK